jgi:transposase
VIRRVASASVSHPCPTCGRPGRRQRTLSRRIRSLAYRQAAFLEVPYAEYRATCGGCTTFRSWPLNVPPKADYAEAVRQAVLDRLLDDGLHVERARAALARDFLLPLSTGFVYDCLPWQVTQLDLPAWRQRVVANFSGVLGVDELHLGQHTLLLATDPLADEVVAFALVGANDQDHLRRFLRMLRDWGIQPTQVISDGSNLYPAVLAEGWPEARHHLGVFHVLQDVTAKVLDAVRRLRRGLERRGLTRKAQAAFVFQRRYLIVKREEKLTPAERAGLKRMFAYLPAVKALWRFRQEVYAVGTTGQRRQVARGRWTRLKNQPAYQAVPELQAVVEGLSEDKLAKTWAFYEQPTEAREKTNHHVERLNRTLRFDEKVR